MDPIALNRRSARRLIVHGIAGDVHRSVYSIVRIRGEELLAAGVATILGGPDALAAAAAAQQQADLSPVLETMAPEARAALEQQLADAQQRELRRRVTETISDPDQLVRMVSTMEAYLRASVEAIGIARPEAPDGVQLPSVRPEDVCEPLTDGASPDYLVRVRLVPGPECAPTGELPLSEIPLMDRIALCTLVTAAWGVREQLAPFPRAPGDPRAR